MSSTSVSMISDADIQAKIDRIDGYYMNSMGRLADAEQWCECVENAPLPTVTEVRATLERHEIEGDDVDDQIGAAISIAMQPEGMPDCACVEVCFLTSGKSLRSFPGRD